MASSNIRIYVSGRVQGVGFRYFTYQQAKKLNLTGYVYNLDDGRVEIVACGPEQDVRALIQWLEDGGPPSSRIDGYTVYPYADASYSKFEIKH